MSLHWSEEQWRAYSRHRGVSPPPAPAVSEAAWMAAVRRIAREAGYMVYHTWSSKRSPEGFPDLVLAKGPTPTCSQGKLVFAELKTETGQVTKAQQAWINTLQAIEGVECHVWRPSDMESIVAQLRGEHHA